MPSVAPQGASAVENATTNPCPQPTLCSSAISADPPLTADGEALKHAQEDQDDRVPDRDRPNRPPKCPAMSPPSGRDTYPSRASRRR